MPASLLNQLKAKLGYQPNAGPEPSGDISTGASGGIGSLLGEFKSALGEIVKSLKGLTANLTEAAAAAKRGTQSAGMANAAAGAAAGPGGISAMKMTANAPNLQAGFGGTSFAIGGAVGAGLGFARDAAEAYRGSLRFDASDARLRAMGISSVSEAWATGGINGLGDNLRNRLRAKIGSYSEAGIDFENRPQEMALRNQFALQRQIALGQTDDALRNQGRMAFDARVEDINGRGFTERKRNRLVREAEVGQEFETGRALQLERGRREDFHRGNVIEANLFSSLAMDRSRLGTMRAQADAALGKFDLETDAMKRARPAEADTIRRDRADIRAGMAGHALGQLSDAADDEERLITGLGHQTAAMNAQARGDVAGAIRSQAAGARVGNRRTLFGQGLSVTDQEQQGAAFDVASLAMENRQVRLFENQLGRAAQTNRIDTEYFQQITLDRTGIGGLKAQRDQQMQRFQVETQAELDRTPDHMRASKQTEREALGRAIGGDFDARIREAQAGIFSNVDRSRTSAVMAAAEYDSERIKVGAGLERRELARRKEQMTREEFAASLQAIDFNEKQALNRTGVGVNVGTANEVALGAPVRNEQQLGEMVDKLAPLANIDRNIERLVNETAKRDKDNQAKFG